MKEEKKDFCLQEKVLELQETNTRLTGQLKENRYMDLKDHFAIMSLSSVILTDQPNIRILSP